MREELVGYLLGALEPEEERELEARLETDAELRRELDELRQLLQAGPGEGVDPVDPPADLARRTCSSVDAARRLPPPPVPEVVPAEASGRWSRFDAFTLAGLAAAVLVIVAPLISAGRQRAQLAACREHMQTVGRALLDYSRTHDGYFPEIPQHGPQARAGIYAVRLYDDGYLSDAASLYCPAHREADEPAPPAPPELEELQTLDDVEAEARFAALDGMFGYSLGYVDDAGYHSPRNHDRPHYAILADAPPAEHCRRGHCGGRNVWFEDGHAEFFSACRLLVGDDAIYENRNGFIGAGIGPDDIVIGPGTARPRLLPVELGR